MKRELPYSPFVKPAIRLFIFLPLLLSGCYTFKPTTEIPYDEIKIHFFDNKADLVNPTLSQEFTDALRDRIANDTKLELTDKQNPQAELKGYISGYTLSPVAPKAGETAALTRLTIQLVVEHIDHQNEKNNWQQNFSFFAEMDATKDFAAEESSLVQAINEQLINDVYRKAFINW